MNWNQIYLILLPVVFICVFSLMNKRSAQTLLKTLAGSKIDALAIVYSLFIFAHYLKRNYALNFGDERIYIGGDLAQIFRTDPPLILSLRTYGYTSIVAAFKSFMGVHGAKIMVSILQFLLFVFTCTFVRNVSQKGQPENQFSRHVPYFLIVTSFYLVQSTTLFLTDIMANCLVAIGVSAMLYLPLSTTVVAVSTGVLTFAGMIRPAALCFLLPMPIVYCVRYLRERKRFSFASFLRPLPVAILVCFFICFPQLMINQELSPYKVRFPVVADLFESQKIWGGQMLKFDAYTIGRRSFPVRRRFPERLLRIRGGKRCGHILAMIEQGETNTYRRKLYSKSRKFASFQHYLFLYLAMLGAVGMAWRGHKIELALLGLSCLPYVIMMSSSAVESRFAYPLLLLAIPLAVQGARFASGLQRKWQVLLAMAGAAWECAWFAFSYWLDKMIV